MKQVLTLLMVWLSIIPSVAQDMKTVFVQMPDSILPLLTKVNREDCVDFLANNMKAVVTNRLDRHSEMKVLTDNYFQMQLTDVSVLEMKLLPLNDSVKIICEVKTVSAPVCDSQIRFYDTKWNRLQTSDYFRVPAEDAFYSVSDSLGSVPAEIRKKADMFMVKFALNPDQEIITMEYMTPYYLNEEDREKLSPYLSKDSVVYKWENGSFK